MPIRLYKDEIQKLRELLKPLDDEMQKEQEKLINAHVPGTRTWLLEKVVAFVSSEVSSMISKNKKTRILWIRGVAGVGKSVMAGIVARELDIRNQLGATYFAKHDDKKRNSGRSLIFTVAFMLAQWNRDFAEILFNVLNEEEILDNPVDKLFSMLILTPLESLTQNQIFKPIAIVVDALDECEIQNHRNEILKIFAEHFLNLPHFVKLIITSRPEDDIMKAFKDHIPTILEPTDEQNMKDLQIYAKSFLQSHISTPECVEYGPEILVQKSEGLFIWLILACTYLYQQLGSQITLQQIKILPSGGVGGMDKIYQTTFQRIFSNIEAEGKILVAIEVLSFIVISLQRLSSNDIANLLNLNIGDVELCIRLMLSVLKVDMHDNCIQVFHKSVVDYLTDPKQCDPNSAFFVNVAEANLMVVIKSLECLNKELHFNICKLDPGILHKDISDFGDYTSKIPKHLFYAGKFWVSHALECRFEGDWTISTSIFDKFTTTHLLHWVELLSICDSLSIIQSQLPQLILQIPIQTPIPIQIHMQSKRPINLLEQQISTQSLRPINNLERLLFLNTSTVNINNTLNTYHSIQTATILKDIKQLVGEFFKPISQSALHVYFSALVLCPEDTELFKKYYSNFSAIKLPKVLTGKNKDWSPCLTTFEGHTSYVNSVAWWISTDRKTSLIASASDDNSIRVWDAFTGIEIQQFLGHTKAVKSIAFSQDGSKLVSGSDDKKVQIWNIETGHSNSVTIAAFSPDGIMVASGSLDKTIRLWDIKSGISKVLEGHSDRVTSVTFSPDGRTVVSGSWDSTVRLWDINSCKSKELKGHSDIVWSVAFSPNGGKVVSGSSDKTLRLWDIKSGSSKLLEGHGHWVISVAFSPDGSLVASGSRDMIIRLWNIQSGASKVLKGHSNTVTSIAFSPDGGMVASGSGDKTIRLWDINSVASKVFEGHSKSVTVTAFSQDGVIVASGSLDKTIRLWDLKS
ncbi:POC1 centriolar protein A, partial [Nowakowskiella sp. JEL0078]